LKGQLTAFYKAAGLAPTAFLRLSPMLLDMISLLSQHTGEKRL
jgi:hypothetical protein